VQQQRFDITDPSSPGSRRLRLRAGYAWELLIDVMKESAKRSVGAWLIEREEQVQVA
jgi:hypothetical protein